MGDFQGFISSVVVLLVVWWFLYANQPTQKQQNYWNDVIEEGERLKTTLMLMNLPFRKFAEQPKAIRDAFLIQEGFSVKKIEDFVNLAKKFPKQRYLTPKETLIWEEYSTVRKARQTLRKGRSR